MPPIPSTLQTLLGGRSIDDFLRHYWQKRPLLIRQAMPGIKPLLSPEELAGLACEEGIESRLVRQSDQPPYWSVQHGPFTDTDFTGLPERNWTLLIQDMDTHIPALAQVLDNFNFIPDWRIDDLMISFASPGGSVGPHTDAYDVFLLQTQGQRRWQINTTLDNKKLLPNSDLQILEAFEPQEEWVLQPGDMLYLPPGVAHHGVALNSCMTWSIGFRAPEITQMLTDYTEWRCQKISARLHYADPNLQADEAIDGSLSEVARTEIRRLMREQLMSDDAELDHWFACFITESKYWLQPQAVESPIDTTELKHALDQGQTLERIARCTWYATKDDTNTLFMNGKAYCLSSASKVFLILLCRQRNLSKENLAPFLQSTQILDLLVTLYNLGNFELINTHLK